VVSGVRAPRHALARSAFLAVAFLILPLSPGPVAAQEVPGAGVYYTRTSEHPAFGYFRTAEAAVANMVVGGLVTGVGSWLRGEGFLAAFGWGTVGGAVSFSGKFLAGRHPHGGGLIGRQVAEVGHSIALNSSRGQRPLDELWLALGPGRVRIRNGGHAQDPSFRINLWSLAAAADYALRSDTRFSPGESLATGALVFEAREGPAGFLGDLQIHGTARGSVVLLSGAEGFDRTSTLGHELVHTIQSDLATRLITAPVEQYVWGLVGLTSPVFRAMEVSNGVHIFSREPFLRFLEAEAERLQP
jgi:hypothetical protein